MSYRGMTLFFARPIPRKNNEELDKTASLATVIIPIRRIRVLSIRFVVFN